MELIRATPEHIPLVAPLFDAYRQFYRQPADPDGTHAYISERLKNDESVIFLALGDSAQQTKPPVQPLGFVQLYPSFSSISMQRSWILNDLFVDPSARKLGVGEVLMEQAVEFAAANAGNDGVPRLSLATEITNTTAQRLYERLGWQRDQKFYHYSFVPKQST